MTAATADPAAKAHELVGQGRAADAVALMEPLARRPGASHAELAAYAEALKAAGRTDEALAVHQRAIATTPRSGVAEHNLAALQGELGLHQAAEAGARRALAKGLDAPETWVVLARALQGLGRMDSAVAAFREALRRRPALTAAHRELAQLIWMRTEDVGAATAALKAAVQANPGEPALALQLATVFETAGAHEAAYSTLISAIGRLSEPAAPLEVAASTAAGKLGETIAAQRHAERAVEAAPTDPRAQAALLDAHLALGRAGLAARIAEGLLERAPDEQQILARLATAWRLMDDPRYGELYDYDAFVRGWTLDTPTGWPNLAAYLGDLATALRGAHIFRAHPFDQTLRFGAQTPTDLVRLDDPAIKAFFQAVERPIRQHLQAIGQGEGPLRRRNTFAYAIQGAWSVKLRPGGFHVDHVHPMGWLSSACHIVLPGTSPGVHEGWLKFGEPGVATQPKLEAERFVEPQPGRLLLFPSYMWHGTVPFSGEGERLSVAFDVVPA